MISVYDSGGTLVGYDTLTFSGGEIHIRMKKFFHDGTMKIVSYLRSSEDIMKLLMITDAIRREGVKEIDLVCPYFPYARQDRVCNPGEALGARVMADLINAQGYRSVEIWDAHSDVSSALLDNCRNVSQLEFLKDEKFGYFCLVSPDAGSEKKVYKVSAHHRTAVLVASKIRDTQTGQIVSTKLQHFVNPGFQGNKKYLIIDDICDGGRTFLELAKEIKSRVHKDASVSLYVTHGIFSRGFDELKKVIDHVYCANIWPGVFKGNEDFVTILNKDSYKVIQDGRILNVKGREG